MMCGLVENLAPATCIVRRSGGHCDPALDPGSCLVEQPGFIRQALSDLPVVGDTALLGEPVWVHYGRIAALRKSSKIQVRIFRLTTASLSASTGSSVQQERFPFSQPGLLVRSSQVIEIRRRRGIVVDPATEKVAAVDDVDRKSAGLILVGEVAP